MSGIMGLTIESVFLNIVLKFGRDFLHP